MRSSNIGGQAVMEGIMMRHKDKYSIAVRRPDNEIELKVEDYRSVLGNAKFLKYPLIRGVVSFIDSLVVGTKCLMYSAEIAGDEEDEEEAKANAALSEEEREAKKEKEDKPVEEESTELMYDSEFEKVKDQYVELQDVFKNFAAIAEAKSEEVTIVDSDEE